MDIGKSPKILLQALPGDIESSAFCHASHVNGCYCEASCGLKVVVTHCFYCNTTSNNDNQEPISFTPLRWGVDSLYLSYPGKLADSVTRKLEELKRTAQAGQESEQAKAQYRIEDHLFEVKDKGAGMFPFVLRDNAFRIALSRPKSGTLPMAYAQVSSGMLAALMPQGVERKLAAVLEQLGDIQSPKVSRIDVFIDFVSNVDMESWTRNAWVTRAHNVQAYSVRGQFSGWAIGLGDVPPV